MPETIKGRDDRPRIEVYNCAYNAISTGVEVGLTKAEIASLAEDNIREVKTLQSVHEDELRRALNIAAEELDYRPRKWRAKDGSR